MMMRTDRICQAYTLACLSPVHVGSGETLRAFEYLYDPERREAYFLDEARWVRFLGRHHLMDAFAAYIGRAAQKIAGGGNAPGESVWEWLLRQGADAEELRSLAARTAAASLGSLAAQRRTLNDIACQAAHGGGHPYVPGSSLKGALRTAILYAGIQDSKSAALRAACAERLRACTELDGRSFRRELAAVARCLEHALLDRHRQSAMRGLLVSDACCLDAEQRTILAKKFDVTTYGKPGGDGRQALPVTRECLPAGTKLRFTLAFDPASLRPLGFRHPDDLFRAAKAYLRDGLALQREAFGAAYPEEFAGAAQADLLLGGGTGFFATTLAYPLFADAADGRAVVRRMLQRLFPRHRHAALDGALAPRTMKFTKNDGGRSFFGLCAVRKAGQP